MGWWKRIRDGVQLVAEIDEQADALVKMEQVMARHLNDRTSMPNDQIRALHTMLQPVFRLAGKLAKWIPG
jgi:hypothetical protein